MTIEEQIKALLLSIEQLIQYGWPDAHQKDQVYEWLPGKKVTIGYRDEQYVIEAGTLQARLLDGYHGHLTIYHHANIVDDPKSKEAHLSTIIERIPDLILSPASNLYSTNVLTID
ncbi:MAG: hypothetical protein VXW87_00645 [Pseudomonadota bacterium]|nr:hypothetical protein [Pseudomonadota bacterium]